MACSGSTVPSKPTVAQVLEKPNSPFIRDVVVWTKRRLSYAGSSFGVEKVQWGAVDFAHAVDENAVYAAG